MGNGNRRRNRTLIRRNAQTDHFSHIDKIPGVGKGIECIMCLDEIKPGQHAVVTGFDNHCPLRRRLQDLGLIDGTPVWCVGRSPLGDPSAYMIRQTVIALRREDARQIHVREVEP